ncbi:DUF4142 domain-containing protein [Streptomyces alkaliterrae]|uniref:DUF4142 domain-containing protein n=1 Tax=Streptomyces alkaliterrae TaxID=2213162 RepID=A0A5P0YTB3_9ACTN|nr:DUF4142 domain-containing protein [Streptomyces alkaliterrae]MBB1256962.1 DUF4142 domain-containing protein [Streptomyces alkaliterrae]MBB1258949.1 DUF4142 domain-containing protein [Streptomyces alkaliterrae]MQS02672.1 DUF4142 domain-containing protein [Streptomyces alkaliterrae]
MRPVNGTLFASGRNMATGLVVLALVLTLAALLVPVHVYDNTRPAAAATVTWDDDGRGTIGTEFGPLTAMDRDFVRKVRLAGLWELPAGRQAQERTNREAVREAGNHLVDGHTELDRLAIDAGRALGVELANQPNAQQQAWLAQMNAAQGDEFDRLFANILRRAHGTVFGLVAQVRAQTRNSMVRTLATRANAVVLDHITVLEATGLVDFAQLDGQSGAVPGPAAPTGQVPPAVPIAPSVPGEAPSPQPAGSE